MAQLWCQHRSTCCCCRCCCSIFIAKSLSSTETAAVTDAAVLGPGQNRLAARAAISFAYRMRSTGMLSAALLTCRLVPIVTPECLCRRWSVTSRSLEPTPAGTLQLSDYSTTYTHEFPRSGSRTTPVHPAADFIWKDYAPAVFKWVECWMACWLVLLCYVVLLALFSALLI